MDILIRFAETIFHTFIPGYKKSYKRTGENIINIDDKEFVDKIIKCADVFDIHGYKVRRIHATDLKWKEVGKRLFVQMEFELEKDK